MEQDHHIIPAELWGAREGGDYFIPELYNMKSAHRFSFDCEANHVIQEYHNGSHPDYTKAVGSRIEALISLDKSGTKFDGGIFVDQLISLTRRLKIFLLSLENGGYSSLDEAISSDGNEVEFKMALNGTRSEPYQTKSAPYDTYTRSGQTKYPPCGT